MQTKTSRRKGFWTLMTAGSVRWPISLNSGIPTGTNPASKPIVSVASPARQTASRFQLALGARRELALRPILNRLPGAATRPPAMMIGDGTEERDRKRVGEGKELYGRVDLGGAVHNKQKIHKNQD